MKKTEIIVIILILIIIAFSYFVVEYNKNRDGNGEQNLKDYYTATYLGSYDEPNVELENSNYEIIKEKSKLDVLVSQLETIEFENNEFDEEFFTKHNLVVVSGSYAPQLNELSVTKSKVSIDLYYGSPLVSRDEKLKFTLYFIPVEKSIENVEVKSSVYPDRLY